MTTEASQSAERRDDQPFVQAEYEKFRELYMLARAVYETELHRSDLIDQKAGRYLTALTFLIGGAVFLGQWLMQVLYPPEGCTQCLLLLLGFALIASLIGSWFSAFKVLRVRDLIVMPLNEATLELFKDHDSATVYYALADRLRDIQCQNRVRTSEKAHSLAMLHRFTLASSYLFIAFGLLYIMMRVMENNSIQEIPL